MTFDRQKADYFSQERERIMQDHAVEAAKASEAGRLMREYNQAANATLAIGRGTDEDDAAFEHRRAQADAAALDLRRRENDDMRRLLEAQLIFIEEDLRALDIKRRGIKAGIEALGRQKRELDHMAGIPIEPMTHFAEVVLTGRGGVSGPPPEEQPPAGAP